MYVYHTWAIRKFARSAAKANYATALKGVVERVLEQPKNFSHYQQAELKVEGEREKTKLRREPKRKQNEMENIFCGSQIK